MRILLGLFSNDGFMPHGHCYLWAPELVWTMVTTDLLIGLAYVSISICLYILVRKIRLPFSAMFLAFGMFIAACGTTHFMEVYTLWVPNYWLAALIKVVTAMASVATALIMFPLFPRVLQFAEAARMSEDRKRRLELLNAELITKTEALVAANKELESFSYSVSHDLRAPLRSIYGFSRALEEDYALELPEQGKEYLKFVRSSAQRMGTIIDDLMDLSRVSRVQLNSQRVDLTRLAKESIEALRKADVTRQVDVAIEENLTAVGDSGLLHLVLENLLSNAWKFTDKSGTPRIEVSSLRRNHKVVYFVRDNGVGFDMGGVSKLFGAFQRLHSFEDYPGTGVGLATAKRIIERHSGEIWAESIPAQATTFFFTIGT